MRLGSGGAPALACNKREALSSQGAVTCRRVSAPPFGKAMGLTLVWPKLRAPA